MHARLTEIGHAGRVGGNFVANAVELAATNVLKILPLGRGGGGFVKIDRNLEALPDFGSDVPGHGDAVFESDAIDRDKGNDIGRAHAGVSAMVLGKVDKFLSLAHAANRGLLNGFPLAD